MGSKGLLTIKEHTDREIKIKVKSKIVWKNVFLFVLLHLAALYGMYVTTVTTKLLTLAYGFYIFILTGGGVTIGAHRYYSHQSFKAPFAVRCLMVTFFTLAGENSLYTWVRDHRQHHKFSDTDADPHNSTRGFFFSHIGWLMMRKHPEVIEKGKTLDLSDLEADPIAMFQKKYYYILYFLVNMFVTSVPCLLWNESFWASFWSIVIFRSVVVYHCTWLVNSAAHLYGTRPYNGKIQPVESNLVSAMTHGEGWHNYHHTFPSDYKASEYGQKHDLSTRVITLMHEWGWAYELKETPQHVVNTWARKFGDSTHPLIVENSSSTRESTQNVEDISNTNAGTNINISSIGKSQCVPTRRINTAIA